VPLIALRWDSVTARFIARFIEEHLDALKVTPLRR
jgi:hypothetical protein